MDRKLNLVENKTALQEKRLFPRFPYCYLTFRPKGQDLVFEVRDIGPTGMQVALKHGKHTFQEGKTLEGVMHWHGEKIQINSKIKWISEYKLGLEFDSNIHQSVQDFFSLSRLIKALRPLHQMSMVDLPPRLKYWLKADGPLELFIWQHDDGSLHEMQLMLFNQLVEWKDGKGCKTALISQQKRKDTPLNTEDEFVFVYDAHVDKTKLDCAQQVFMEMPEEFLTQDVKRFLSSRLRD